MSLKHTSLYLSGSPVNHPTFWSSRPAGWQNKETDTVDPDQLMTAHRLHATWHEELIMKLKAVE